MNFPAGKHDDQVDALGLIGQVLDKMTHGKKPTAPEGMRGANEMTMDKMWKWAVPKERDPYARI